MKTWNEVTDADVYEMREIATEGRLATAITRLEFKMMELTEMPEQAAAYDLIVKIQRWREILRERYEELKKARIEELERPAACPLKPAPEYTMLPPTKKQKKEIKKRKGYAA